MGLPANNHEMNGFGMTHLCVEAPPFPVFVLACVHLSFYCVPGVTFSPEQLKAGWASTRDRGETPIQRKGSVFAPPEGAAHDTVTLAHCLTLLCAAPLLKLLCVIMHMCVCCKTGNLFLFCCCCFSPAPPKLCSLEALIPQHRDCLHFLLSDHLSSH